jgi:hypothetical protein
MDTKNIVGQLKDAKDMFDNMFSDTGSIFSAGILQVEGNNRKYKVLDCGYEIRQQVKDNGEPASGVGIGLIKIGIYSPGDNDLFFYEWMKDRNETKEGKIILSEPKERPTKTIEFKKAYCVGIADSFEKECANTKITISAGEVSFGRVSFQSNQGIVKDDKFYQKTDSGASASSGNSSASAAIAEVIGAGKNSNV